MPGPTLISDFTGADENPLSEGGNWAALSSSATALKRLSNQAVASSGTDARSYWTPANFGPDLEAYATLGATAGVVEIIARIQGEGGANTWDGYKVRVTRGSATSLINIVTNSVATVDLVLFSAPSSWAAGDKVGMCCAGSCIQLWRQVSGGSWQRLASAVDSTYTAAGKIGLHSSSAASGIEDFYAATNSDLFGPNAPVNYIYA